MKSSSLFLGVLTLILSFSLFSIVTAQTTPVEQTPAKTPDFSPPKDLSGPTFPIEDLIGHPTPESDKFMVEFVKMAATLGLVIALILIIAWFLKRMLNAKLEQGNSDSSIQVIERRALSQKTMVYLLEIGGKGIVVAESHQGVTFLGNYPVSGLEAAEGSSIKLSSPFNQILEQNNKQEK